SSGGRRRGGRRSAVLVPVGLPHGSVVVTARTAHDALGAHPPHTSCQTGRSAGPWSASYPPTEPHPDLNRGRREMAAPASRSRPQPSASTVRPWYWFFLRGSPPLFAPLRPKFFRRATTGSSVCGPNVEVNLATVSGWPLGSSGRRLHCGF